MTRNELLIIERKMQGTGKRAKAFQSRVPGILSRGKATPGQVLMLELQTIETPPHAEPYRGREPGPQSSQSLQGCPRAIKHRREVHGGHSAKYKETLMRTVPVG